MQFQAGYILPAVHQKLREWAGDDEQRKNTVGGLFEWITAFDVVTTLPGSRAEEVDSLLAVATNLLTRGLPTLPSVHVEHHLSEQHRLTQLQKDKSQLGKIEYKFTDDIDAERLLAALHPIVPTLEDTGNWYQTDALDSTFEGAFIEEYLRPHPYLAQLLQQQRPLETLAKGFTYGKVDFSLEIPYWGKHGKLNRYRRPATLNYNRVFIAEVDGKKYHDLTIDRARDYAVSEMGNFTTRVLEEDPVAGAKEFVGRLLEQDFVQRCKQNFFDPDWLDDSVTHLVLRPLAVARIQRILLWYLLSQHWCDQRKEELSVLIVEHDIVAGDLAVADLRETLQQLGAVREDKWAGPQVRCDCVTESDLSTYDPGRYDLVIDHSMLMRSGLWRIDHQLQNRPNVLVLRNCHYVAEERHNQVVSAPRVHYVVEDNDGVRDAHSSSLKGKGLEKFLGDLFRKSAFRPGQLPILARALRGKSVIGLLPTGGGKSLTYQLAALLQPGITIVVDPIRSLMVDQDRSLRAMLIDKTAYMNSSLDGEVKRYIQNEEFAKGALQFLFISPERFVIEDFREALRGAEKNKHYMAYVIIDEAHCVSEWGHDFRTPYLNLGVNAQQFCVTRDGNPVTLFGLTATASFDVLADIERELQLHGDDGEAVVRFENTVRDEVNYHIQLVNADLTDEKPPYNEYDPNRIVGTAKQKAIDQLLADKAERFSRYDDYGIIRKIAGHTFTSYLSEVELARLRQDSMDEQDALERYRYATQKRVQYGAGIKPFNTEDGKYNYGIIIFTPHRTGWLGMHNGNTSSGVLKTPSRLDLAEDEPVPPSVRLQDEYAGFFSGSSDLSRRQAASVDRQSFVHMDRFTANENSVMVATKAFGMGIDKPNIRMTVHLGLPSSIESYVQEAGRAGRDRKTAVSTVLFNDDIIPTDKNPEHHVDFETLNYFHQHSFKGQMKERTMLYELRQRVRPPCNRRLAVVTDYLQQEFPEYSGLNFNYWSKVFNDGVRQRRLYINADSIHTQDYLDVANGSFHSQATSDAFQETLVAQLQSGLRGNIEDFPAWLEAYVQYEGHFTGVETQFKNLTVGQTGHLTVYFTNEYYSKPAKSKKDFILNRAHLNLVKTAATKVLDKQHKFVAGLSGRLQEAVRENLSYEDFLTQYNLSAEESALLLNANDPTVEALQRAYYANRSKSDTDKAIYRLSSIGIIDTYTIDYQNDRYNLTFTKHEDYWYFEQLENYLVRYSSKNRAKTLVANLRTEKQALLASGDATPISVCLEFLTGYIYDNIRKKRRQAIDDMISLCRNAVTIPDLTEQNIHIKDEIFYYFNAKYSRPKFVEKVKDASGGEEEAPASMPDDQADNLETARFVNKYLDLVENTDTGEFINNVKHLRGSCMRLLRSHPDEPHFILLKSFTLFILAASIAALKREATQDLSRGLIRWSELVEQEGREDFSAHAFVRSFGDRLCEHVDPAFVQDCLAEALETYNITYYAKWLHQFNNRILTPQ